MGNTVGILQPGYLPWLGFFEQLAVVDIFVIYDDVQYDKNGWRNRNRIKGNDSPVWLTVPVKASGKPLVKDVEIASGNWAAKHIKSICQYYSKAPFFDDYANALFSILERKWHLLLDLDMALICWLAEQFSIVTDIVFSSALEICGGRDDRLIGIVRELGGDIFYEGISGRNYIDSEYYKNNGVQVVYQEFEHPVYKQLGNEFIPYLSAIDLLFNCGAQQGRKILFSSSRYS